MLSSKRWTPLFYITSGMLMFAATPPYGLGLFAFFSLIPLLYAVERSSGLRQAAWGGYLAGLALYLPGLFWLTSVTSIGWVALALYCAVYSLVFALIAYRYATLPALWAVPVLASFWTLLEYIRGILFTGFPWLMLSHTQSDFISFTQILDVIGSYALSGVIVAVNVLLYQSLVRRRRTIAPAVVASAMMIAICAYGYMRIRQIPMRPSHRVAAVQASVPQEMKQTLLGKYDPGGVLNRYLSASDAIPREVPIDILIWPETVLLFPYTLNVNPDALNAEYSDAAQFAQSQLRDLAKRHNSFMLVGATSYLPASYGYVADRELAMKIPEGAWQQRYNSAFLLDPNGKYADRYDKMHLVPFGEYVPLPTLAPFLARFVPFESSLIAGERQTIFRVDHNGISANFGVLICYEDTDAVLARGLRQLGADYLVNISNDAWFGLTELDQHFVTARFRAIENRAGVVRSGNNGFTAVIDPFGRVERDEKLTKNSIGHFIGQVFTTDVHPPYSRYGDWPIIFSCVAIVVAGTIRTKQRSGAPPIDNPVRK